MCIQAWHTKVRLKYQKCNFLSAVADRLQRDIFVIGLNDRFRAEIISRDSLTALSFDEVISKARDFEDELKAESAITQQQLHHKVAPSTKPIQPHPSSQLRTSGIPLATGQGSDHHACPWKGSLVWS